MRSKAVKDTTPQSTPATTPSATDTITPPSSKIRCNYKLDWSPVAETALRYSASSEMIQEILVANAKSLGTDLKQVPSRSLIGRTKKKTVINRRDSAVNRIKSVSDTFTVQFDGKENMEAFLITHLDADCNLKTMPLEVVKSKRALTGKELGHHLTELPVKPEDILCVCSDTTAVNSGTGKLGGACYWFQELSDSASVVVMCRLH